MALKTLTPMNKSKIKLGGIFYPTSDINGGDIPFDSLFIPYIFKEIYLEGIYVDIFNQKKDMVIIDVGANIGVVTQYMRQFAKKIYAIEPSPEHFEALNYYRWIFVSLIVAIVTGKQIGRAHV